MQLEYGRQIEGVQNPGDCGVVGIVATQGDAAILQGLEGAVGQNIGEFSDAAGKEWGIELALTVDIEHDLLPARPGAIVCLSAAGESLLGGGHCLADEREVIAAQGVCQHLPEVGIRDLADGRVRQQAIQRDCLLDGSHQFAQLFIAQGGQLGGGRSQRIADQAVEGRWVERVQQFCQLVVDGLDGINELVGVEGIHKLGHFFVQGFDRRQQL